MALRIPRLPHPRSPGERLLRANWLDEAEAVLIEEAERHPRRARQLLLSGHLSLMRNDLAEADARLSEAVARDPRCHQAHELLAEVAYRRGDFDDAAVHLDAAGKRPAAAKLRSFHGRTPYLIQGPTSARIPFVMTDPLPVVTARVNGGPEASFLIDTGGAELILDAVFADAAEVPRFGGERSFFGGGKKATIVHGAADSLTLGDVTIANLPVNVMDLAPIGPAIGVPDLAGIIGTCVLYRFRATLDYPGNALVLRRKGEPAAPSADAIEVPVLMADDHFLLADGRLNDGPTMLCFVDSGLAGGAFACPRSTLAAHGITRGSAEVVQGHGGGGAMSAWPFDVAALSLGAARNEGLVGVAGVFPPQLERAYGFRIGGLVSHGFLRDYAVTFDFERMVIVLEPAPASLTPPST